MFYIYHLPEVWIFSKTFSVALILEWQTDKQKDIPIMYWLPKLYKTPIVCSFTVASKQNNTKPLTKTISNIFKMIYFHVENFHNNSQCYSNFEKFWVVQRYFPIFEKLTKINHKKNAETTSTFDSVHFILLLHKTTY